MLPLRRYIMVVSKSKTIMSSDKLVEHSVRQDDKYRSC
jgi:hypothetical protein